MDRDSNTSCGVKTLWQEIAGFHLTNSHNFPNLSLEELMAEVTACRVIKDSVRRQIFYLQTPSGGYFLKRSVRIRAKDRLRHFFLPRRRWAEWRNLHRMHAARISAPLPVLRGEKTDRYPKAFFVLTRKVDGSTLRSKVELIPRQLGQYFALLHACGVYHADLHPENILIKPDNEICLLDVQEVFWLPWLPRWLRVYNLGKLFFHLHFLLDLRQWSTQFLDGYNFGYNHPIVLSDLCRAANHHRQRHFRSRTKRCCKNSTEFVVVNRPDLRGFKRRAFNWGATELKTALKRATTIKTGRIFAFKSICIKIHRKRLFHRDRCLASWKMSRSLEVRQFKVPRALGYLVFEGNSYFLSEYLHDSVHPNEYLSSLRGWQKKRRVLQKLACWLKELHTHNIWQRDFKSTNILCQNDEYFMLDLDSVKIRQLSKLNIITNLAQLNASIGNAVSLKDRIRFLHYYWANENPSRNQRRFIYRKVWDITKTKNTHDFGLDLHLLVPRKCI